MSKIEEIITKFNDTGNCEIDIDLAVSKWNKLFKILQWDNSYRLVKYKQHNSSTTVIKIGISVEDAKELIKRLDLKGHNGGFASATTWESKN